MRCDVSTVTGLYRSACYLPSDPTSDAALDKRRTAGCFIHRAAAAGCFRQTSRCIHADATTTSGVHAICRFLHASAATVCCPAEVRCYLTVTAGRCPVAVCLARFAAGDRLPVAVCCSYSCTDCFFLNTCSSNSSVFFRCSKRRPVASSRVLLVAAIQSAVAAACWRVVLSFSSADAAACKRVVLSSPIADAAACKLYVPAFLGAAAYTWIGIQTAWNVKRLRFYEYKYAHNGIEIDILWL